ncbi:cytochrome c1 [Rickettsiales bacterium]|nr:cytochrome c1 [Rickettsiales bacterium]
MKNIILLLMVVFVSASNANAAGSEVKLKKQDWSFDGLFGTVDSASARRGFKVYKEVCASCHSLKRVAYRNLEEIGFSPAAAKAIAADAQVVDGPNDDGDMFERPGRLSDKFVAPFANDQAARASNGGALPPDLSLIIKARPDGANYLYSLMTGYSDAPADVKLGAGMHYNKYFPGGQIAMPAPLFADAVEYEDGTEASVDQMSKDLVSFLQWAAEPEMQKRKRMGAKALIYLLIFTILFYIAKKRIWARL